MNFPLRNIGGKFKWTEVVKDINNVHPMLAYQTLKSFGFREKIMHDKVSGTKLNKFPNVENWKRNFIARKFPDKAVQQKIASNTELCLYLGYLVQLVNANPSILNQGKIIETEESKGMVLIPEELVKRGVLSLSPNNKGKLGNDWAIIQEGMRSSLGKFSRGLTFGNDGSSNSPFGVDNLFPSITGLLTTGTQVRGATGVLFGGAVAESKVYTDKFDTAPSFTKNITTIFKKLLANLKSNNKILNEDDQQQLKDKLDKFAALEQELYDTAYAIMKYSNLAKMMDANQNEEFLTVKHIKNYVNKYNGLLDRHDKSYNAFNTLISLIKGCNKDDDEDDC